MEAAGPVPQDDDGVVDYELRQAPSVFLVGPSAEPGPEEFLQEGGGLGIGGTGLQDFDGGFRTQQAGAVQGKLQELFLLLSVHQ